MTSERSGRPSAFSTPSVHARLDPVPRVTGKARRESSAKLQRLTSSALLGPVRGRHARETRIRLFGRGRLPRREPSPRAPRPLRSAGRHIAPDFEGLESCWSAPFRSGNRRRTWRIHRACTGGWMSGYRRRDVPTIACPACGEVRCEPQLQRRLRRGRHAVRGWKRLLAHSVRRSPAPYSRLPGGSHASEQPTGAGWSVAHSAGPDLVSAPEQGEPRTLPGRLLRLAAATRQLETRRGLRGASYTRNPGRGQPVRHGRIPRCAQWRG